MRFRGSYYTYDTYSANSIDEIINAINQLHNSSSEQEEISSGKPAYCLRKMS